MTMQHPLARIVGLERDGDFFLALKKNRVPPKWSRRTTRMFNFADVVTMEVHGMRPNRTVDNFDGNRPAAIQFRKRFFRHADDAVAGSANIIDTLEAVQS